MTNPAETQTFTFTAHQIHTEMEIEIFVEVADDGSQPYADLADEAEEKAYSIAARRLRCKESQIEVISS